MLTAILAGGRSRRLGWDKAERFLEPTVALALAAGSAREPGGTGRALVIGRERPEGWPLSGVVFLPDTHPDVGPLGGLHTALTHAGEPVLLLACDMPALNRAAISWLLSAWDSMGAEAAGLVPRHVGGGFEPLFALYAPSLLPLIEQRIAQGRHSLIGLIEAACLPSIPLPESLAPALANINTPDDWAAFTHNVR